MENYPSLPLHARQDSGIQQSGKEVTVPEKPEKPMPAFMKFLKTNYSDVKAQHPDVSPRQIVVKISQLWALLEPATKQQYKLDYNKQFAEYKVKLKEYQQSMTSEQKKEFEKYQSSRRKKSQTIDLKQKMESLGKPKQPKNSFLLFMDDCRMEAETPGSMKRMAKVYSEKWNDLSAEEKQKYMIQAAEARKEYNDKLQEWERKMAEMGYIEILRKSSKKIIKGALENKSGTGQGTEVLDSRPKEKYHGMNESVDGNITQETSRTSTNVGTVDYSTEKQVASTDNNRMSKR